jgi:Secretion system C-terminal sorting domain
MDKKKVIPLEQRIFNYSLTAGLILAAQSNINASVVVTSSGHGLPATVNSGNISYGIDFDGVGGNDISISYSYYVHAGGSPRGPFLFAKNLGAADANFYGKVYGSFFNPYPLSQNNPNGVPSAPSSKWGRNGSGVGSLAFINSAAGVFGYWVNQTDKYLGVKFKISGVVHYGWVKMSISADSKTATITSYAYETSADTPISSPLPVELTRFSAINLKNSIALNWATATEVNNYGFEIQRTLNPSPGKGGTPGGWEKIGFVKGNGNSNSPKEYSFVDNKTPGVSENPGGLSSKLEYRLKQIDNDGQFKYSKVVEVLFNVPAEFSLKQNYPNPFNPTTSIRYSIPRAEHVTLKIYDVLGKEAASLVDENKEAGSYNITFNASGLASGIYYYRITAGEFTEVKKLMLLK